VVLPGNNITYTITVTNGGPSNATGVVVTDLLPAGVTLVSAKGTQGDFNQANRTLTWNVGTLSNGSSATLTIVVTVNTTCEGGQQFNNRVNTECAQCNVPIKMPTMCPIKDGAVLINRASIRANVTDPNLWNNAALSSSRVSIPNLKVTKKDELLKNTFNGGVNGQSNIIRYTVIITNASKSSVSGFTFSDTPDTNSSLVVGSVTTTSGVVVTGNTTGNTSVVVNLGTMPAGGKVTITFKVTVNKTLPYKTGKISNQGVVSDNNSLNWLSDDPDTREVGDPTVTQIAQFAR
jgi:large repetitive protein